MVVGGGSGKGKWVTMYSTHTHKCIWGGWPFSTHAIRHPHIENAASTMTMSRINPTIISSRCWNEFSFSIKKTKKFIPIRVDFSYLVMVQMVLEHSRLQRLGGGNLNLSALTLLKPGAGFQFPPQNRTPLPPFWGKIPHISCFFYTAIRRRFFSLRVSLRMMRM